MEKFHFDTSIRLEVAGDDDVYLSVNELWGKNLKKLKKFPLREFAEVYTLIQNSISDGRSYLGGRDYGDTKGNIIVHLYNTEDDFIIDVIDGHRNLHSVDGKIVVEDDSLQYSCRYNSLAHSDKVELAHSLRNLLFYCNKHNISDVYAVFATYFSDEIEMIPLCNYLVKNDKRSIKDYLDSGVCEEEYKKRFEPYKDVEITQRVKDYLFYKLTDMEDYMNAYITRYDSVGKYIKHDAGSYCLLLHCEQKGFIQSITTLYSEFSVRFYREFKNRGFLEKARINFARNRIKEKVWRGVKIQGDSAFEEVFNNAIKDYI